MDPVLAAFIAVIFIAILAAGVANSRDGRRRAPARVGYRVTVHTKKPDDQTLYGVAVGDYADVVVLEDAEYVTPLGGKPIPGRPHIAVSNISWIDVHELVSEIRPIRSERRNNSTTKAASL